MGATIEIAYFNTFILAGGGTHNTNIQGKWHVEESRIKGGYNEKSVDFGVRAHLVDDEHASRVRGNAMIYSGIFNAKTKVNNTNQFSIGQDITKAVDIINGSIQKLYAEDTNLIIFQENKVSRALIDKDAIFTAEGSPLTASSKIVIGEVGSFSGKYGISKNPESFAVYGGRKYFADKNRGLILRLSQDGITPISDTGMRSFFRDNLLLCDRIYGMYDEQKNKYIISLQSENFEFGINSYASGCGIINYYTSNKDDYRTLGFDEASLGWVSFYTYKPVFGFSSTNKFYTFKDQNLYQHHRKDVQRCSFYYRTPDPCDVEFILNDQPNVVKNFLTIDYEGTSGWTMYSAVADAERYPDSAWPVVAVDIPTGPLRPQFIRKENKYYGDLRQRPRTAWSPSAGEYVFIATQPGQIMGLEGAGIKGYYNTTKMQYWKPGEGIASSTPIAELFAVSNEAVFSSQ